MAQQLRFIIPVEEVRSNVIFRLGGYPRLLRDSKILARAPISGFQDVAIAHAGSDRIFIGVNVEFEGLSLYDYSISAKDFLFTNLALNFEREIYIATALIPFGYCPSLPSVPQNNCLALSDLDSVAQICSYPEHCSHLKCRALMAANRSYAQYSQCPSGVALLCRGEVYRGWYNELKENSNIRSLGPLQAALVDFVARSGGQRFEDIDEAVLVEMKDADVSQEETARILFETIAPGRRLKVFHCHKTEEK